MAGGHDFAAAAVEPADAPAGPDVRLVGPGPTGLRRAYVNGVISNACNPKIGVFFVAFLPNVMPAGAPVREVSLALGAWFALETGLWLAAVVWMADHAKAWLSRPHWQRRLEQLTGLVLVAFGIRVATEGRDGPVRSCVRAGMPEFATPLRTTDAVVTDTPASSATSRSLGCLGSGLRSWFAAGGPHTGHSRC